MANEHLTLEARQKAGQAVERDLMQFMIFQCKPCEKLLVGDLLQIAEHARRLAFDHFSDALHAGGFDGPTGAD